MTKRGTVLLVTLLAAGTAFAADPAPNPAPKPNTSATPGTTNKDDLDARLEAAQKRLEAAAAEVGALASEQAGRAMQHMYAYDWAWTRRAIIGVQLDPASGNDGARVKEVSPGGPAAEAGVLAGDVIVAVNGKDVKGKPVREVVALMRDVEPESKVKLNVVRAGKPKQFEVVTRPQQFHFNGPQFSWQPPVQPVPQVPAVPPVPPAPAQPNFGFSWWNGDLNGMELATLTPQLGRYFGTDKGVLVVRAPTGETYKLQDGDVILSIDGRVPTNGSHATRILRSYQAGEKLNMHLMRDRKPLDIQVVLPDWNAQPRKTVVARPDDQRA